MIKSLLLKTFFIPLMGLVPVFTLGTQISALAQSIRFNPPPVPAQPNSGEPGGRPEGGGSRGCNAIALVPTVSNGDTPFRWGLTTLERPTFWIQLTKANALTKRDKLAFTLQDDQGKTFYSRQVAATEGKPGVIRLTLPSSVAPLQVGKSYRWSFSMQCDATEIEDRPSVVVGRVQRVAIAPALKQQLAAAKTPQAQARVYAQNGIWYDAIAQLGNGLRAKQDPGLVSDWVALLQQAKLNPAPPELIRPCCALN